MNGLSQSQLILSQSQNQPKGPAKLEFENEQEFLSWLKAQKNQIVWRKHDKYHGIRKHVGSIQSGRPVKVEWSQIYRCPFSGKKQLYVPQSNTRRNSKGSIKVGCKATIKVKKHFDDDRIMVTYDDRHLNHNPNSTESWKRQVLSPDAKKWLKDLIETGANLETFKNLACPNEKTLLEPNSEIKLITPSIPQTLRIRNSHFNYYRSKYLQKAQLNHTVIETDSEVSRKKQEEK